MEHFQNLDGWKLRRRKQSEDAIERLTEIKKFGEGEDNQNGHRKSWVTFHYKSLYSNNRWSGFSHFYYAIARSLGKKISLQYQNDDVIDFADLDLNDDKSEETEAKPSNGVTSMASRRESRGISEVS